MVESKHSKIDRNKVKGSHNLYSYEEILIHLLTVNNDSNYCDEKIKKKILSNSNIILSEYCI